MGLFQKFRYYLIRKEIPKVRFTVEMGCSNVLPLTSNSGFPDIMSKFEVNAMKSLKL